MRLLHRTNLPNLYFLLLPLVAVGAGIGLGGTLLLLLLGLLWKWGTALTALAPARRGEPALRLETISASPFVEKVRWCLDRLGVPYREEPAVGVLGVFLTARSVPRLHVRAGGTASVIGDSPDILRWLWAHYAPLEGPRAAFLEPTVDAVALETRLDAYALDLRRVMYFLVLPDRETTLHVWGRHDPRLPTWQRWAATALFPVLRAFVRRGLGVTAEGKQASQERVERFLAEMETRLGDGRTALLGGERHYVDLVFAAFSGLWIGTAAYGGGQADHITLPREDYPEEARRLMNAWRERFPRVTAWVEHLYATERGQAAG